MDKKSCQNKCSCSGGSNESTKSAVSEIGSFNCSVSDAIHGAHSVIFSDSVMDNSVFAPSEGEARNGAEERIISQVSQFSNSEIMSFLISMEKAMNI
ncbi:hypothetical protein DPMN_112050 [Dreissena polymorpha]|uniref:Uncharacterized protein n=1 Tax=Dreissena polymorpha TaxID=45954 RepID=A0A9D4KFS5_DREPO|nr:hypothetical protein DPMN_112047 [Dreissena polymorpha]KAH3838639.1 hypothetical protein DPMN_112048 [Dreissena polymorpha]KAH3838641.1 hypothetical protein DPMN_112050 [Dreissena polymorpha]